MSNEIDLGGFTSQTHWNHGPCLPTALWLFSLLTKRFMAFKELPKVGGKNLSSTITHIG
jgi:hypothetical protein